MRWIKRDGAGRLSAWRAKSAARLGAIYIAIATTIHGSIVLLAGHLRSLLLAGHLRSLLIAGAHQKSIRRILSFALVLVAAWLAWSTRRI